MKKALLIVCAVVCSVFYVSAQQYQDVVYLKNGSVVRGVILEQIPGKSIKLATDNGSQFIFPIYEVEKMSKELVGQSQPQQVQAQPQAQPQYQQSRPAPAPKAPKAPKAKSGNVYYKGEVNLGFAFAGNKINWETEEVVATQSTGSEPKTDYGYNGPSSRCNHENTVFSRPLIETVHGAQIGDYFFLGAGFGFHYFCGKLKDSYGLSKKVTELEKKPVADAKKRWNALMLPLFANFKFTYPVNDDLTPYVNVGIGGTIGCASSVNCKDLAVNENTRFTQKVRGGFYCDLGLGFRYKVLNLGVGFQHQDFKIVSKETYSYSSGSGYNSYSESSTTDTKKYTKVNSFYVKLGVNF